MKSEQNESDGKFSYEMSIRNHERMLFATNLIEAIKILRMHDERNALESIEEILKDEINRCEKEL
jgi:hypothetical protein